MKKIDFPFLTCICYLLLTCCSKPEISAPATNQPPDGPPGPTVVDSITGIAVSTRDNTSRIVSVFNPDGSLRWKKRVGQNNGMVGQLVYDHGRLFLTYGLGIYAYDIKTGALLWNGFDFFMTASSPTINNGVLYSCTDSYELLEIDPSTGGQLKYPSVAVAELVPYRPLIKDSTAYVVTSTFLAYYSVRAIDIKKGTEKWVTPIGYNPPAGLNIVDSTLSLINGTSQLKAININTGKILWELKDQHYIGYVPGGSVMYALWADGGVAAIDVHSGSKYWSREIPLPATQFKNIYLYDQQLVFQMYNGGDAFTMTALKSTTGDPLWSKSQGYYFPELSAPVVSGGKLFQFRADMFEPYETKLMIYDPATYDKLDSIDVEGDSFEDMRIITKSEN